MQGCVAAGLVRFSEVLHSKVVSCGFKSQRTPPMYLFFFSLFQGVCVSKRVSPWLPFWLCWQPFTFPPLENGCRVQLRTFWCAFQKGDRRKSVKGLLKLTKKNFSGKRTLAVWLFCQPCVASRVQQQIPSFFLLFLSRVVKSLTSLWWQRGC